MANHSLPTVASLYTDFVTQVDGRLDDLAQWLASDMAVQPTNLPSGSVRWNTTAFYWEKWNGMELLGLYFLINTA